MLHESAIAPVRGTRPKVGPQPRTAAPRARRRNRPESFRADAERHAARGRRGCGACRRSARTLRRDSRDCALLAPNQLSSSASAPRLSFAISTAPAASSRLTTVASSSIVWFSKPPAPHVVRYPATEPASLFLPTAGRAAARDIFPRRFRDRLLWPVARARSSVSVTTNFRLGVVALQPLEVHLRQRDGRHFLCSYQFG